MSVSLNFYFFSDVKSDPPRSRAIFEENLQFAGLELEHEEREASCVYIVQVLGNAKSSKYSVPQFSYLKVHKVRLRLGGRTTFNFPAGGR